MDWESGASVDCAVGGLRGLWVTGSVDSGVDGLWGRWTARLVDCVVGGLCGPWTERLVVCQLLFCAYVFIPPSDFLYCLQRRSMPEQYKWHKCING